MQRKSNCLNTINHWHQNSLLLLGLFFCSMYIFLSATPAFAASNAKGIEIEYLSEQALPAEINNINSEDSESKILTIHPSSALTADENNLWLRMESGYRMPEIISPYTSIYENRYASKPAYVEAMIARSSKYLFHVVEEVEKRGMPMEIALLPMIESAYNPKAISRSKAVGIWQFMPATGKHFGLKQNWWADHRQDVTASTDAALNYLEKLHNMFDSWDLALAAYNAGEGTVGRAIAKNRKLGLPTDYQSLKLPLETTHYVPKLQAIKNIVTMPEQYGLNIATITNQPYFTEVDAPNQIDAKLAAKLAGISHEEFALLNPRFKRPIIASRNNTHKLLLPLDSVAQFETSLQSHDESLVSWKVYKAKQGERVSKIAKKFSINTSQLRKINGLPKSKKLPKPFRLLVPAGQLANHRIDVAKLEKQKIKTPSSRYIIHKIKRGETLSVLAKKYGTNTRTLMRINGLRSTKLKIGQSLQVKGQSRRSRRLTHKIKRGETLGALAKRYGTNTRALMRMNRLKSTKLKIGQIIQVKGSHKRAKTKRI